jgi:HlyD family secretion protein
LKLDDTQLQMELAHVQTQRERTLVEIARLEKDLGFKLSELKRNESLLEKGMVARQALDNLKAISESSQFQLVSAKKNLVQDELAIQQKKNLLNKTVIRAPLDGTVISIPIKIGETAIPSATSIAGSELMTITQSNAMIVDAQIAEYDINRVKVGQKAEIRPRSDPNQVFLGEVMRVANYINSAAPMGGGAPAHTVAVKIQLDLNGTQLPSGLSCDVKLLQGSMPNAVLIPLAAVQYEETRSKDLYIKGTIKTYHVWRVKEGKAYKQAVELGFADEHMQEIRRGLQKDEEVIVGPTQLINTLKEGMAISTQFKKGV